MAVSVLTSKCQITIPKEIRKLLKLKPADKIVITVEKDHAILKPVRGNILDLGGTIKIPEGEKPIDFKKARKEFQNAVAQKVMEETKE
ncbi:MAG: AbrB/MazE/SpoVT family DNA-binding domain-containing protein [Candidatus Schekmanbacteria bacterium]|nr:AbrB/MazE/SpoVT family DNA-binding domain-containing protein [Candidatus Schekmanbacteria bacterium]